MVVMDLQILIVQPLKPLVIFKELQRLARLILLLFPILIKYSSDNRATLYWYKRIMLTYTDQEVYEDLGSYSIQGTESNKTQVEHMKAGTWLLLVSLFQSASPHSPVLCSSLSVITWWDPPEHAPPTAYKALCPSCVLVCWGLVGEGATWCNVYRVVLVNVVWWL